MKYILITLMVLAAQTQALAWSSKEPHQGQYSFKFTYEGEVLEIQRPAGSYEEAFEKAAESCFKHFKGERRLSEDQGLDLIDVCANPRS